MLEHFARLDTDRENDKYGDRLPLVILQPWEQITELWGEATVHRIPGGIELWCVVRPDPDVIDPYKYPLCRIPETMVPVSIPPGKRVRFENDWRGPEVELDLSGYLWVVRP